MCAEMYLFVDLFANHCYQLDTLLVSNLAPASMA